MDALASSHNVNVGSPQESVTGSSTMSGVARLSAVLTAGFTLGATAWFFFLQSPVLIKFLGKKKVRII